MLATLTLGIRIAVAGDLCVAVSCVYLPTVEKAAPTPALRGGFEIRNTRLLTRGSARVVVGEVTNPTASAKDYLRISATFYDSNDRTLASADGLALLTRVYAGQTAPFRVVLPDAPPSIARYTLAVYSQVTSSLAWRAPVVLARQTRENDGPEVFGEVRNDQPRTLRGVLVAVTFYDKSGQVVFVDSAGVLNPVLPAGATTTYKISTFENGLVYDHFTVQAEGYVDDS